MRDIFILKRVLTLLYEHVQVRTVFPNAKLKNIYGMTETGAIAKSDTLGKSLPYHLPNLDNFHIYSCTFDMSFVVL